MRTEQETGAAMLTEQERQAQGAAATMTEGRREGAASVVTSPRRRAFLPASLSKLPRPSRLLALHATWEALRIAAASLRANKLRTGLTLIGIVVGVAAVIAVVTIIRGLDQTVASTFSSQGSTVFSVSKRPLIVTSREEFIRFNRRKDVTEEDAEAVFRLCSSCWRTGIAANNTALVKHEERESEDVRIRGLTLSMFAIEDINVVSGREWTDDESGAGRDVCVVGADVIDNVFGGAAPETVVGREVRVGGQPFEIVGVAERLGKVFGFSRDNFVLIPYTSSKKLFGSRDSIIAFVQASSADRLEATGDEVRTIMRNRRGKTFGDEEDGFTIETQGVFIDLYGKATSNIYIVTVGVAAISLVVGGIVVMNIMLVSVTERTREIGIRKAVGASRRAVLTQFLIEAVVLTAVGGALGVGAGFGLAVALSFAMGF
ncbi:MAG: ABC transporter permease, partial [Pyrinomonadaceae bacterium]